MLQHTFCDPVPPGGVQWIVGTPTCDGASVRFSCVVFILVRWAELHLGVKCRIRVNVTFPPARVMSFVSEYKPREIRTYARLEFRMSNGQVNTSCRND